MFTTQLSCWQTSWLIPPLVCDISQNVPLTLTFGINYIYMLSWNRLILYSEMIWLCMSVKIRQFGNARIINKYALFSIRDIIHIFFNYWSRLQHIIQQDMHGCRLVTNKVRKAQGIMKFKFVSVAKKLFLYFHHENLFRRIIFCHKYY